MNLLADESCAGPVVRALRQKVQRRGHNSAYLSPAKASPELNKRHTTNCGDKKEKYFTCALSFRAVAFSTDQLFVSGCPLSQRGLVSREVKTIRTVMDTLTRRERSKQMALIRSKDTQPELIVRRIARSCGYRFRLNVPDLPGKPDLVFPKRNKAIFVHGCFWHGHSLPCCCSPEVQPELLQVEATIEKT